MRSHPFRRWTARIDLCRRKHRPRRPRASPGIRNERETLASRPPRVDTASTGLDARRSDPYGAGVRLFLAGFVLAGFALLAACNNTAAGQQAYCSDSNKCIAGRKCVNGFCQDADAIGSCSPLGDAHISGSLPVLAIVDRAVLTVTDCNATAQPGADIDAVGLYRAGSLIAVGRVGVAGASTVLYTPASGACALNEHATSTTALGPRDAAGNVGFFSLNGGTLELQFAGCGNGATTIEECDGKGAAVVPQSGDEIDVYEVDQWYSDTGRMPKTCKCEAEKYELDLRSALDVSSGQVCLGQYEGTTSHIRVP
jgi:hypothetical protein